MRCIYFGWMFVEYCGLTASYLREKDFFWRNVSQINSIERTNFMAINYRYKRNWFSLWTWFFLVEYMRWFPVLLSNLHLFQFKGMKLCSNANEMAGDSALIVSVSLNKTKIKKRTRFPTDLCTHTPIQVSKAHNHQLLELLNCFCVSTGLSCLWRKILPHISCGETKLKTTNCSYHLLRILYFFVFFYCSFVYKWIIS